MRVAMLNHNPYCRGTFWRVYGFARALAELGVEVDVYTLSGYEVARARISPREGLTVTLDPASKYYGLAVRALDLTLKLGAYDIVHSFATFNAFTGVPTLVAALLRKPVRTALVVDFDDWWCRGGFASRDTAVHVFLEEGLPRNADALTFVSKPLLLKFIEEAQRKPHDVIPNGLNLREAVALAGVDRDEVRCALGLPRDKFVVFFMGFTFFGDLSPRSPFRIALEAFADAVRSRGVRDAVLVVAGGSPPSQVRQFLHKLEITDRVVFVGRVERQRALLYARAADVNLMPVSRSAPDLARVPIRLLDYVSACRPVITTVYGEVGRLALESGLCVPAKGFGAEDYAEAIEACYLSECRVNSTAWREFVVKYDWRSLARRLLRLYAEVF